VLVLLEDGCDAEKAAVLDDEMTGLSPNRGGGASFSEVGSNE
jgi:hypothetical protein